MKERTTIFFANPNNKGHCSFLLKKTIKTLTTEKKFFTVVDLYDDHYDPIMHKDEQYTNGKYTISAQTKKYRDLLKKSSHLIFIYPVWWNGMPAQLKGFFDKVFGSRFAFKYKKYPIVPFPIPVGLLKGKKAVVFTTTGAQWWMSLFIQGNRFNRVLVNDILKYCGIKSKGFTLHSCLNTDHHKPKHSDSLVKRGLNWLYKS